MIMKFQSSKIDQLLIVCEKFFFANLVTYYDDVPRILYTWFFDQGPMLFLAYSSFLTILSVTLYILLQDYLSHLHMYSNCSTRIVTTPPTKLPVTIV